MEEPNIIVKTALNEAVQKVNSGVSPSEALKKVAEEYDLNPNFIQRTGEALNVALNYRHFKTASDRSLDFEIADIPKVIGEVFSFNQKTAAEEVSEHFPVADTESSVFNYNRMLSNPVYKRAFLEISGATETNDSFPTTFRTVHEKAANYIQKLEKEYDHVITEKTASEYDLNCAFSNLSDEFRKDAGYRTAFEEFESQVFSKHGSQALPYVDLLHKTAAKSEERGVHDRHYIMYNQCKEASMFDSLMEAAAKMISLQKKADEISHNLKYERDFMKECSTLMGKKAAEVPAITPQVEAPTQSEASEEKQEDADPVMEEVKKKEQDPEYQVNKVDQNTDHVKEAFLANLIGGLAIGAQIPDASRTGMDETFSAMKLRSFPKKPKTTLDNMERKLLIQELILTDPILSKMPPIKVVKAYEQLLRLSPEISKEKEIVRSELRAMVSTQALSKFDADLLTKLDTSMVKRRMATEFFHEGSNLQNIRI